MQEILGSVRRSLVFRSPEAGGESGVGNLVDKINSCIVRKSIRVFSRASPPLTIARDDDVSPVRDDAPPIRWRKGELIGCGAFGQVYVGMNLDSGELLAVKQVLIAANSVSNEKAQAHIRELEEEVKLLKNLSHPNIVRYLGTVREEETLNILLEFVPGGSISSLLGKFGSFPEAVIRMYTKQLLLGLDYLHGNGIMHRDIKGANILVDNKGCIKLADFGASKKVVELATMSGAKSMKGTPYWMAPEVILQTGHNFSADIWSVGCTVIEMATGKPPWSQQYQEVAALFYIGTTKAHPPIPEHLSAEAKDFLLKCLQKEPELRPCAFELLQHPFVTGESMTSPSSHASTMATEKSETLLSSCGLNMEISANCRPSSMDVCNLGTLDFSSPSSEKLSKSDLLWTEKSGDDVMCEIDDKDVFVGGGPKFISTLKSDDIIKSINPVCEPSDDWRCDGDVSVERVQERTNCEQQTDSPAGCSGSSEAAASNFSFSGPSLSLSEDDDEVTESKIRAFLDEKAIELKKLQTPLYEEFFNCMNASCSPNFSRTTPDDGPPKYLKLPPKSRSPSHGPLGTPDGIDGVTTSPGSCSRRISNVSNVSNPSPQDTCSSQTDDLNVFLSRQEPTTPSMRFSEIQRKWKEELDQELERTREKMRQASVGGKTSSPKDRALNRQRERSRFASPGK